MTQKSKFLKENKNGYYSRFTDSHITEEEVADLVEIVADNEVIYKFFNTMYSPFDVCLEKVSEDKEKVNSRDINDIMCAKTITHYKSSFKVMVSYGREPVKVVREFSKNTTLSARDVAEFM